MNFENKFARFMRNSGPARFFIPLGIILIVFGVIMFGFDTDKFLETTGKITDVVDVSTDKNQKEYDVSIAYTVDGKEYQSVFGNLSGEFNVGDDIKVFYNPEDPEQITNTKTGKWLGPAMIAVGALAIVFGILKTVKAVQKSRELDAAVPGETAPQIDFSTFKNAPGVTEYYCRYDKNTLRPGYIIEDAWRNILFEGTMTKNALVGTRSFEFKDHTTGAVTQHEVGHTMTQSYNNEFFSTKSWFKIDGRNIWDVLHERGLRMTTDIRSKFPNLGYDISKNGAPFARIETSGMYVHEDDAAQHKLNIPVGRYYYRIWTDSKDFETLFLTVFAISETEQTMVE